MLSSHNHEVRRLTELAKALPDVRSEKINLIRNRIESGTYKIPPEAVAEGILDLQRILVGDRTLRLWRMMRRQ